MGRKSCVEILSDLVGKYNITMGENKNARNGNLEVPAYFLKAKQGYTARKI
jgi:hypothetical protein